MSHSYPRKMTAEKSRTQNRPGCLGKPCDGGCGHVFARNEVLFTQETQVNWFRGDDEVAFYCESCAKEKLK